MSQSISTHAVFSLTADDKRRIKDSIKGLGLRGVQVNKSEAVRLAVLMFVDKLDEAVDYEPQLIRLTPGRKK
jgi:hypothetical protein